MQDTPSAGGVTWLHRFGGKPLRFATTLLMAVLLPGLAGHEPAEANLATKALGWLATRPAQYTLAQVRVRPLAETAGQYSEDFETGRLEGWELGGGARVAPAGRGHCLTFSGPGHAAWHQVRSRDFTLRMRYRHGEGAADVSFRASGEPPGNQEYHLLLTGEHIAILRIARGDERQLGVKPAQLQRGQWYDLTLQVAGGAIQASLNRQTGLSVSDPQPLGEGILIIGCAEGEGFGFDDITLTPSAGRAPAGPPRRHPATEPIAQPVAQPLQGQATAGAMSENFEVEPLNGWHLAGGARRIPVERGQALGFPEPGHGIWHAVNARDFQLRSRFRMGEGLAEVVLCGSGEPPNVREYQVHFGMDRIAVLRNVGGRPQQLSSAPSQLRPGAWVQASVSVTNGTIQVSIDGQTVVNATDAQPLGAGVMAFGCLEGSGFAYDDITLNPAGAAATGPVVVAEPVEDPGQRNVRQENFDRDPLEGWELLPGAEVVPEGTGRALVLSGETHAFWVGLQERDFALTARYRHAPGVSEVLFRASGEPPNNQEYHLRIRPSQVSLSRVSAGREHELASDAHSMQPGAWHRLLLQTLGGKVFVAIDGAEVLGAEDTQVLPKGMIGFGSLEGGKFAFDDITVTPADAGTGAAPTVAVAPGVPATQPLAGQIQPGGAVLAALAPSLVASAQLGLAQPGALLQRVSTPAGLASLSQSSGLSAEHLVLLAQATELTQVVGSQNIGRDDLSLLALMDIERPEDLAAYAGNPGALHAGLTQTAAEMGMKPPSPQQTAQWVQAASQRRSQLPAARTLLPAGAIGRAMAPRVIPLAGGLDDNMVAKLQTATTASGITMLPMAIVVLPGMLQPTQKFFDVEFSASQPGLYRGEVNIQDRKGGIAELNWQIDKPKVVIQMAGKPAKTVAQFATIFDQNQPSATVKATGWTPLLKGDTFLQDGGKYYLYFWLGAANVPLTGNLRLRLMVKRNESMKYSKMKPGDPDAAYVKPEDRPKPDPIIRLTASVTRQKSLSVGFGQKLYVPVLSNDPNKTVYPVQAIETPLYTPQGPDTRERSFKLEVTLWGKPRTSKPHLPGKQVGSQGTIFGQIPVLRNGMLIGGKLVRGNDLTLFTHSPAGGVKNGIYTVIFNGATTVWSAGRGMTVDRRTLKTAYELGADVQVALSGGKIPQMYVAELLRMRVSDQAEPDDDDRDDGDGEFKIQCTTSLSKKTASVADWKKPPGQLPFIVDTKTYKPQRITTWFQGSPATIQSFPMLPVAEWTEGKMNQFDSLAVTFTVMEDDSMTWWQQHKKALETVFGLFKSIWSAYSGDFSGALTGFVQYVKTSLNGLQFDDVDDFMGAPAMTTAKDWGWGLMAGEDENWFSLMGPSDLNRSILTADPGMDKQKGVKGLSRAMISAYMGEVGRWAGADVRIRKVSAPWSWGHVELLGLTLNADLDGAGDPADLIFKGDPWLTAELKKDPRKSPLEKLSKVWWPGMPVAAHKGKPVSITKPRRPDSYKQGDYLLNAGGASQLHPIPYTHYSVSIMDQDAGSDFLAGELGFTFYHEDFYKNVGKQLYSKKYDYHAKYYRDGPFYVGDFIINNPGLYLSEVRMRVYVYIWEGS